MYFDLILLFVSFLFLITYVTIVLVARNGLLCSYISAEHIIDKQDVFVNLIVVFKNEESNLSRLIESICLQNYTNFRVIWIDDNSTDNSVSVIKKSKLHEKSLVIKLKESEAGKKNGIKKAVGVADGDFLVFTDADCFMNPEWISTYVLKYKKNGNGLYFGAVQYAYDGFMEKLFAVEFSSLVGIGLGLAKKHLPVYFNAANYAFSSSIKSDINNGINENYASGDDVFLLHYLKKKYNSNNINVVIDNSALVYTVAPKSFNQFIKQRIRWGAKSKGYNDFFTLFLAINVFVLSFLEIVLLFYVHIYAFVLLIWCVKIAVDVVFLSKVKSIFNKLPSLAYPLIIAPFYPFYIVFVGLIGLFVSKSKWIK